MASQLMQPPLVSSSASSVLASKTPSLPVIYFGFFRNQQKSVFSSRRFRCRSSSKWSLGVSNKEDTKVSVASTSGSVSTPQEIVDPDTQDLEYISQVKRVLGLLKANRDMAFNEVKLTIMIEDLRDVERKRLLGIEDENAPTKEDLAACLEEINEGKIPEDRLALKMLAEEMNSWPNLEVEVAPKKKKRLSKSLYAKATDTGIDPKEAAKRLKMDWDEAAEIDDEDASDEAEVPPAVGYGALYLVTAFPVIIGISVVLILFYNSLQ